MIKRIYDLHKLVKKGKVLIIYGPRRAGKTTLLDDFLKKDGGRHKLVSGDDIKVREILSSQEIREICEYAGGYEIFAVDEAQQIENIGLALKILVDNLNDLIVVVTGSSSFEIVQKTGEPLTGRKRTLILYPFSQKELLSLWNVSELKEKLEEFLIFGSYPEVVMAKTKKEKIEILEELANSYLLKDILSFEKIKSSKILIDLLRLLAFQIGSLVSLNELSGNLKIDVKTVGRYLDLLEKNFVIKKVGGFSRNLRSEISSKCKYYFVDNGIRNAVIAQYQNLKLRNDIGGLWENFFVVEKMKKAAFDRIMPVNFYFWRTYGGKEIDLIEEMSGKVSAYEIKWGVSKHKFPKDWKENYKNAKNFLISKDNYLKFLL